MGLQAYEEARVILAGLRDSGRWAGPQPERRIAAAEERLGVRFPPSYRKFLAELGAGGVEGIELLGVEGDDQDAADGLSVVWHTLHQRRMGWIPYYLIPIYDLGDGEQLYLDLRGEEGAEARVLSFKPGSFCKAEFEMIGSRPEEVAAEDFGEFYLDLIQQAAGG